MSNKNGIVLCALLYVLLGGSFGEAQANVFSLSGGQTYTLNDSTLTYTVEYIGDNGSGAFIQHGGSNYVSSLCLGFAATDQGIYRIDGGEVHASYAYVGYYGNALFSQSGGVNYTSFLRIGENGNSSGTYNLSGGDLNTISTSIAIDGVGSFNQSGGSINGKKLSVNENGTYNFSGGALNSTNIYNDGLFNVQHSSLNDSINGSFTNNAMTRIIESESHFNNDVTNNGVFDVSSSTVNFSGKFTNNGEYISSSSANYFYDLYIGKTGSIAGMAESFFSLAGDFVSDATDLSKWYTPTSTLEFTGDSSHDFYWGGSDTGTVSFFDNFSAWSLLSLAGDETLSFYDSNSDYGAGLYIQQLDGLLFDEDGNIKNLFAEEGFNIYYLAELNEELGGKIFDLSGGGQLIGLNADGTLAASAAATPLPGAVWLLASGFLGIGFIRRRLGNV
ncbi:VPLPA-CTERM sorting domain-containing protein [Desulfovibrio inopinatus]|uniref:VPLPA-CTERM sorting domain-containing protein n=1 Tax=Desulfovibrio inopinatus TaxID=102109 RepID=UPI0003FEB7F9|nr:VPLPA-CTERM sorting domain-containing protein [Desulfovibrio inopinatus]